MRARRARWSSGAGCRRVRVWFRQNGGRRGPPTAPYNGGHASARFCGWSGARADARGGLGRLRPWAESEAEAQNEQENAFLFYFQTTAPSLPILNTFKAFSRDSPKIKIVLNFDISNFVKRTKVRISIVFEI